MGGSCNKSGEKHSFEGGVISQEGGNILTSDGVGGSHPLGEG